jgi:hypothetical protein
MAGKDNDPNPSLKLEVDWLMVKNCLLEVG